MPINYGQDDYPFIKEALRFYIEKNEGCDYKYQQLFNNFKTEPCIFCEDTNYDPKLITRKHGKLICDKCKND